MCAIEFRKKLVFLSDRPRGLELNDGTIGKTNISLRQIIDIKLAFSVFF